MAGYQVMPRMAPELYENLEQDIIENGVQVPIVVSMDGTIIDGHHRDEIARKHSLHCPRTTMDGDEVTLRSMAYRLNINRRDLSDAQRDQTLENSLRTDPILRDAEHARRTGFSKPTVKKRREELGLPSPDDVIRDYATAHPEKSNREIARDLGISDHTVAAIKGAQKVKVLQNAHPAPEWEDVGTIPQSRLKDIARPTATNIPQSELDELNEVEEVRPVFQAPGEPDPGPEPARQHPSMPKPEYTPEQLASKRQREANERSARYIENFAIAYATVYQVLQNENLDDIIQLVTPNIRNWFTVAEKEMTWPTPM